jgi:integrase
VRILLTKRIRLNQRLVQETSPGTRDLYLWDSEVVGFGLKITPAGSKGFVLQYRFEGRSRRYAIGRAGSPWTVEAARVRARELLGQLAGGADPQEKKTEARRALSVSDLMTLYVEEGLVTRKPSSRASAAASFRNHIQPILGARKAALVTRGEVERMAIRIAEGSTGRTYRSRRPRGGEVKVRGGRGAASSALVALSGAYSLGLRRGLVPHNPVQGVRKFPSRKVERFLSPAEFARLGDVLAAAEALGVQDRYRIAAIKLLLLTGCRRGEILTLKHAYVDRPFSCLRLPDSKTGQKVVHVGSAVLALIEALPEVAGNPYVLPGRGGVGCIKDLQTTWEQMRAAAGLADVRLHDLRHSFASFGAEAGDSLMVIGALLGHRSTKSTERYAHLSDHPVKDAAQRISERIAGLMGAAREDPPAAPAEPICEAEVAAELKPLLGQVVRARWLDTRAAAARSGMTTGTLATYRWMGVGPPFRQVQRRIVYDAAELDAWLAAQRVGPTPAHRMEGAPAASA